MQFRNILEELEVTKFRKDIEREIEGYFEEMGFSIIEPKIFQDYDDFINSNSKQDSSKTVKVLGGDSRIYILRPDITTNILRQIFLKWEGEPPLKVYYNSKVYKNEPGVGILENYQMGIESLGDDILKGDREVVEMAVSLMSTLGEPYLLELGSSKYLDGFFREINLSPEDELELRQLISKKNRDSLSTKLRSLKLEDTILNKVLDMQGSIDEVIDMARSYDMNEEMKLAINSLENLNKFFIGKDAADKIKLDLSMVADLDYYDGIIFKGYCLSVPSKILSGGRYDKSTEKIGLTVPAIGFMIDMDLVTRIRIKGGKIMDTLTIAIAKGRLGKQGLKLFNNTEYEIVMEEDSRKLIFTNANEKVSFIFVKPCDVVTYVEKGVADLGIVGKDTILEDNKDIYEVMDLDYGNCRFAVAGFEDQNLIKENDILTIATNYPSYVESVFKDKGQRIEIIKLGGAVELAPLMGLSEVIVDIVETGTTLKDNGLVILEELDPISARLIVNKVSYRFKYDEIQKIEKVLGEPK